MVSIDDSLNQKEALLQWFEKNTIGEEGNGKPPHKIHFPRNKLKSPVSGFCYARNRVCDAVLIQHLKGNLLLTLNISTFANELFSK